MRAKHPDGGSDHGDCILRIGFTHLNGLAEFGILGGVSALIGSAMMLLVLPAAIAPSRQDAGAPATGSAGILPARSTRRAGLSLGMPTLGRWLERKSARNSILSVSALLLVGGVIFIR